MDEIAAFEQERSARISANGADLAFADLSLAWMTQAMERKYVYNFSALGRPIIQFPQDMVATQELIWQLKPDLIIETGIAHGGSLIQSAMMLAMIDMCKAIETGSSFDPVASQRKVVGIDIDIREHNRAQIENHPMASRIHMIEGSSIDPEIIAETKEIARNYETVLVLLDSMHSHDHVLGELRAYGPMTSIGSYCVVYDTFVEDLPKDFFDDRPWDIGDNPKTAVHAWLKETQGFEIDNQWDDKLMISVAPDGFLKRFK
jgi:cephalosporin hydroxylase